MVTLNESCALERQVFNLSLLLHFILSAMKQYNGVPLDGKAMRIEIAGTGADMSEAPLRRVGGMGGGRIGRREDRQSPRRTGGGGGGGRRAGRGNQLVHNSI